MKELINKLLSGNGKLSLLLLEANEFAEGSQDKELIEFIDNELNGYSNKEIPEYRKINAVITGTIKNSYGQIIKHGEPLDFSALSKQVGIDVSISIIPDGIGFIEDALENLTDQIVERPLHIEIVRMLQNSFKQHNSSLYLTYASHQFGKAGIQFILTKVRQDLIVGLRKIYIKPEKNLIEIVNLSESEVLNTVFVTYAWENEDQNDKVISFVEFLRNGGYEATMDKKEAQEQSATNFNHMMIDGIQNSNKVIIVLSKRYKEKADAFSGGVGFEFGIILEQLKTLKNKFIFVSFGTDDYDQIVPLGILGRDILNLKKDQDESNFNTLFAKLQSKNVIEFSPVSSQKTEVVMKKIQPFQL